MWISFLLMPEQTTTNLMVENNASSPHSSVSQKSSTDLSRVKSRYQQAAFFSGHCRRESISLPFPAFLGPPTFLGSWSLQFSSVQFISSVLSNSLWPHESQHTRPPCPSPTPGVHSNSCPLSRWCHPALLLLPPIPPSIRVFSNVSTLRIRWPKFWSFSFSISPSNEHPGLISFRMDWLDLLAVQGTLKSLLQHHSSKA